MRERNYLQDIFADLLQQAREAKRRAQVAEGVDCSREFEHGRALAFYEVLSTMLNQLDAFQIPRDVVGVPESLDLENELL